MIFDRWMRTLPLVILTAALAGCIPSGSGQLAEEKEPHFLRGRELVNALDYGGAIASFEKALELNPHSGAAHFELGWLYADKQPDPAAAIYHYEQYLKLRPRAENANTIQAHILRQKQELAKSVLPLPSSPSVQRQVEQLMEENKRLQTELARWQTFATNRGAVLPSSPTASGPVAPPQLNRATATNAAASRVTAAGGGTTNSGGKTHRVAAGETPSSIARKYHVKLEALLAANPGLNPNRMKVGQTLNVPAP